MRKKSVYTKYEFWLSEVGQSNAEKMQVDTKGLYRYFLWLDNGEMRYSCKFYKKITISSKWEHLKYLNFNLRKNKIKRELSHNQQLVKSEINTSYLDKAKSSQDIYKII